MKKKVALHQIDTFTEKNFQGCSTSIILGAEKLKDDELSKIAMELGTHRLAFTYPSDKGDLRLRFFIKEGSEVKFCSSGALAALTVFGERGLLNMKKEQSYPVDIETRAGLIPHTLDMSKKPSFLIGFDVPNLNIVDCPIDIARISEELFLSKELFEKELKPQFETSRRILFLPVKSLESLAMLDFDPRLCRSFIRELNIYVLAFVSLETIDPESSLHVRSFSPLISDEEELFDGSLHGALGAYLHHNNKDFKNESIVTEQGDFLERPGRAMIQIKNFKTSFTSEVKGYATPLFSTELPL
ncbi:MAG: PhzF family phenazine biosynthesis isomerase [Simkaniaceae bacterium]